MHNVFLLDTCFALFYLVMKRIVMAYFEINGKSFMKYKLFYYYFEFSVVMFGVIYMPQHTPAEAFIGFSFCIVIKWCFNNLLFIEKAIYRLVKFIAEEKD